MVVQTEGKRDQATTAQASRRPGRRRSLFRKYLLVFVVVISTALAISGALQILYAYRDQLESLRAIQLGFSERAANQIGEFTDQIVGQLRWAVLFSWNDDDPALFDRRRADGQILLQQRAPAITELFLLDGEGRERLVVSQFGTDRIDTGNNWADDPAFITARDEGVYHGPVFFRRGLEPYIRIAVAGNSSENGVAIGSLNLVLMTQVIAAVDAGGQGWAYVVDNEGRLIAHPDMSQVLRNTSYADLPQVAAALAGTDPEMGAHDPAGNAVISEYVEIPELGWRVFTEVPSEVALQPIYASLVRTGGLLLLGLGLATIAGFVFARRLVSPIRTIQLGAQRIGAGDLGYAIEVHTGDEIEDLSDQFNDMAVRLQESYSGLERRVLERTNELSEKSKQLEIVSQHKSQFLANMSHELRTPLNAIIGYAELLSDNIYGTLSGEVIEVLERVQYNSTHLLQLINDVLDLSKIEAGELRLSVEDCEIAAIVEEVRVATESLAQKKNLALRTSVAEGVPTCQGDARRLTQVVLNLVGNAIKFTEDGFVEIRASSQGASRILIEVEDTGPGIPEDKQNDIFGEFHMVDDSSTRNKGGTGLGLAISKRIVEMHGGTIGFRSHFGPGSTFWVNLPVEFKEANA